MTERAEGLYWTSTPEGDDIDVREWSLGLSDYGLGRGWWSLRTKKTSSLLSPVRSSRPILPAPIWFSRAMPSA